MSSKATVFAINRLTALVAARSKRDGNCTIFELRGRSKADVGDTVEGDLEAHGQQIVLNVTTAKQMDVYVYAVDASTSVLRALVG
jgi:hypothetical protein